MGLCTHADAANVYEFDISTSTMRHLANLTILLDERGKGIWTNGKIHVRMQELDGYVYFGSFCEDNGPPAIDANSYNGPRWFRINMETGKVEPLSKINSFWGLTGQTMDKKRRIIYGLDEIGHLSRYYIDKDYTEDMAGLTTGIFAGLFSLMSPGTFMEVTRPEEYGNMMLKRQDL